MLKQAGLHFYVMAVKCFFFVAASNCLGIEFIFADFNVHFI